jgi:hypothetical protein
MAVGRRERQGKGVREQGTDRQGTRKQGDKVTRKQEQRERGDKAAKTGEGEGAVEVAKPTRRWRGNGAARLRKSASRIVAENSERLVNLLLEDAENGKMESARLLVKLADETEPPRTKRRRGLSWASNLIDLSEFEDRHGGLTIADLPGSEENWKEETYEALEMEGEQGEPAS